MSTAGVVPKEEAAVGSQIDRQTNDLAESYIEGRLSRRTFVTRLLALGVAPGAIGSILAACGSSSSSSGGGGASAGPTDFSGNVRFLIGPWSDQEVAHQQRTAKAFQALHPKVTFSFRLYDWGSASQQINTSVIEGAHDIYMTTESSYPDYEAHDTFVDLAPRVNAPSFAAEKAKYLYMDRVES
jgi:multiple sugar transport system substrate-binding protein